MRKDAKLMPIPRGHSSLPDRMLTTLESVEWRRHPEIRISSSYNSLAPSYEDLNEQEPGVSSRSCSA
jgi:hypothetical protein